MRQLVAAALAVVVVGAAGLARADDKASPTGTWKWSTTNAGGQSRETTLKLKLDGDTLTGAIVGRNGETKIEDGTFKDGKVSFSITRERNGNKSTTKYSGKVSGDTITGKIESERGGKAQSRDWSAKRSES